MKSALTRYRVMATIVGVLLVVLILVGVPLKYLTAEGSDPQQLGEWITTYLGVAHGWLYMIFLVTAFLLARRERWDATFTVVTLVCGTVPMLSFWAEHRATARVRREADVPNGPRQHEADAGRDRGSLQGQDLFSESISTTSSGSSGVVSGCGCVGGVGDRLVR